MYGGLLSRLQHIRAGPALRSKVLDYYDFKYANKESRADELMHTLPVQIQYELTKLRFKDFVLKVQPSAVGSFCILVYATRYLPVVWYGEMTAPPRAVTLSL